MSFGNWLKSERERRGISRAILAERLGVSVNAIQAYESGTRGLSVERLRKVSQALDIPLIWVLNVAAESTNTESVSQ